MSHRMHVLRLGAKIRGPVPPLLWWGAHGATLVMLALGWWLKQRCLAADWSTSAPFATRCYSDTQALWSRHRFATDWPYLEAFNEYPPLTAAWQAMVGRLTETPEGFVYLHTVLMALVALATTSLLLRAGVGRAVYLWALAPALAVYYSYNWDLLAALPAAGALAAWERGRPTMAGALLAVGALAKWWPAALLPLLGMALLRRERRLGARMLRLGPQGLRFGCWAVGILAIVNGAVWLWARDGYEEAYRFHAGRGATAESHWYSLQVYLDRWGLVSGEAVTRAAEHAEWAFLGVLVVLATLVALGRLRVLHACVATIASWQAILPVLSVQYILWLLPLLVLAKAPARLVVPYLVTDLLVFTTVMRFFVLSGEDFWRALEPLALSSMLRLVALLVLTAWSVRAGWQDPADAAAAAGAASAQEHATQA